LSLMDTMLAAVYEAIEIKSIMWLNVARFYGVAAPGDVPSVMTPRGTSDILVGLLFALEMFIMNWGLRFFIIEPVANKILKPSREMAEKSLNASKSVLAKLRLRLDNDSKNVVLKKTCPAKDSRS